MTLASPIIIVLAFATLIGWLTWSFVVDWRRMHRKPSDLNTSIDWETGE